MREESTDGRYLGLVFLFLSFPLSTLALIMMPKVMSYRRAKLGLDEKKSKRGENKGVRISGVPSGSNVSGSSISNNHSAPNTYSSTPMQKYSSNVSDLPPLNEHSFVEHESEHNEKESFTEELMGSCNDPRDTDVVQEKDSSPVRAVENASTTRVTPVNDDASNMNVAEGATLRKPPQDSNEKGKGISIQDTNNGQDSIPPEEEAISPVETEDHQ